MASTTSKPPGSRKAKPALPLKRFLVPVDFSPRSKLAIQYAGALAQRSGGKLELLFVVEPAPFYSGLEDSPLAISNRQLADTALKRLHKLAETLPPPGVDAGVAVRQGKAHLEIAAHAREQRMDLIVIPTNGYSGVERVFMGSTAEQVVRHAPCAVLTLRLDARAGGVRRDPRGDVPHLRRILAPVDFSGPSAKAVRLAGELADRFESALTVLHVVFSMPAPRRLAAYARRLDMAALEEARKKVATLVQRKLHRRTPAHIELAAGLPHDQIVRAARRLKADLIVIATRGRTGLKRWFMGSTAEQVIRYAPCPVLVVRQAQGARARPLGRTPPASPALLAPGI
ncbi:MAG: universal stress protein [Verrucomicrobia bacterium]|nr:universal stress protein [Verrucomicrobiota bacterium]